MIIQRRYSVGIIGAISVLWGTFFIGSINTAKCADSEPVFVIANKSFPVDSLSQAEVKRLFLKKQKKIMGKAVVPINARKHSTLRKSFAQKVLRMSSSDELSYWEDYKMKEGSSPPLELGNTVRAVFGIPYGISYCFKSDYKPNVAKVLLKM